jgi:hypothetical protein
MIRAAAAILWAAVAGWVAGCSLIALPGDPARLPPDDPRVAACGIPTSDMWMAFPMAEARDFTKHFPGWSEGADELLVPDPALVIIGPGHAGRGGELAYDMCIAVGPPTDALIHRYGPTRFDFVLPDLNGPVVPMP